jgi:hypothetical protein
MSELQNSTSGDDFEWVNAWAADAKPAIKTDLKSAPKPEATPVPAPMAEAGARFSARDMVAAKPAPAERGVAALSQSSEPGAAAPSPGMAATDPDKFVHPATQRFFAALRAPAPSGREEAPSVTIPPAEILTEPSSGAPLQPNVTVEPALAATPPASAPVVQPAATEVPQPVAATTVSAARRFFAALRAPPRAGREAAPPVLVAAADASTAPVNESPLRPALEVDVAVPPPILSVPGASFQPAAADVRGATNPPPAAVARNVLERPANPEASPVPKVDLLAHDIAEIERARDALLEPAPFTIIDPRKVRGRFSALRNADSVPILVGSVVGATLLIVFGAAASLISLR